MAGSKAAALLTAFFRPSSPVCDPISLDCGHAVWQAILSLQAVLCVVLPPPVGLAVCLAEAAHVAVALWRYNLHNTHTQVGAQLPATGWARTCTSSGCWKQGRGPA